MTNDEQHQAARDAHIAAAEAHRAATTDEAKARANQATGRAVALSEAAFGGFTTRACEAAEEYAAAGDNANAAECHDEAADDHEEEGEE